MVLDLFVYLVRILDHSVTRQLKTIDDHILTSRVCKKTTDMRYLLLHEDLSKIEGGT